MTLKRLTDRQTNCVITGWRSPGWDHHWSWGHQDGVITDHEVTRMESLYYTLLLRDYYRNTLDTACSHINMLESLHNLKHCKVRTHTRGRSICSPVDAEQFLANSWNKRAGELKLAPFDSASKSAKRACRQFCGVRCHMWYISNIGDSIVRSGTRFWAFLWFFDIFDIWPIGQPNGEAALQYAS